MNDNSIKQGFMIGFPYTAKIKIAKTNYSLKKGYLIVQNLSKENDLYMSFKEPVETTGQGFFSEEGAICIGPKQAWQEFPEDVHQGDIWIYSNHVITAGSEDNAGFAMDSAFVSVNYNGAWDFFKETMV